MPKTFPANMCAEPSRAASGTICRKEPQAFADAVIEVAGY
jgi:hypothetical protein